MSLTLLSSTGRQGREGGERRGIRRGERTQSEFLRLSLNFVGRRNIKLFLPPELGTGRAARFQAPTFKFVFALAAGAAPTSTPRHARANSSV